MRTSTAHSVSPASRNPSIISFAVFDSWLRPIHADIVKAGSISSMRAAASRASASRPKWAKADLPRNVFVALCAVTVLLPMQQIEINHGDIDQIGHGPGQCALPRPAIPYDHCAVGQNVKHSRHRSFARLVPG